MNTHGSVVAAELRLSDTPPPTSTGSMTDRVIRLFELAATDRRGTVR
jgi:hypothetical protein